jgi:hypothetical protein
MIGYLGSGIASSLKLRVDFANLVLLILKNMRLKHVYFFVIRELVPLTKRDCRARGSFFCTQLHH